MLERRQHVPLSVEDAFAFYSDVDNLERITPPWLRFRILDPRPGQLSAGARLQYSLVLHRFPIRWTTEIDNWEPPHRFIDFQVRGPYRLWEHTHMFEPVHGGTLLTDRVRYAIPYGPLGCSRTWRSCAATCAASSTTAATRSRRSLGDGAATLSRPCPPPV